MLTWQWTRFPELSGDDVYDVLALRAVVFVVEQQCVYLDADGFDRRAWHLLGRESPGLEAPDSESHGALVACLRVVDPGLKYAVPSIGRVVVDPSRRGTGLGHVLMAEGLRRTDLAWPGAANRISAQAHVQGFYRRHGYVSEGAPYLEDDIPHVAMERTSS